MLDLLTVGPKFTRSACRVQQPTKRIARLCCCCCTLLLPCAAPGTDGRTDGRTRHRSPRSSGGRFGRGSFWLKTAAHLTAAWGGRAYISAVAVAVAVAGADESLAIVHGGACCSCTDMAPPGKRRRTDPTDRGWTHADRASARRAGLY